MPMRFLTVCLLSVFATIGSAAEKWADEKLSVAAGLELWFDASRLAIRGDGARLEAWPDASGTGRGVVQRELSARPTLVKIGTGWVVRFDGEDDYLRVTGMDRSLDAATVFLVAASHGNPGAFTGFCAANGKDQRDYESGFTIDQGPYPTLAFSQLNVEGRGFGGAQSLLTTSSTFGTLHVMEATADPKANKVRLVVDGKPAGERPFVPGPLRLDEFTLGARYYTNGPGPQQVRGFLACDIAEVLVYNRVLTAAEATQVRDYLSAKHAETKKLLPDTLRAPGTRPLQPILDPPPVQVFVPGFSARQLPLDLTNINNLRYRDDGKLVALAYDGNVYLLTDTDGDGLEDKAELFWDNKGRLRSPIGMALTPPGNKHGRGLFVAAKGKCSLIVDTDGDDVADKEVVIAEGWKELPHGVDALGVAIDPKDQSVYFGLGAGDYTNAYLIDKDGKPRYTLDGERGTVLKVSPDFKKREIFCTGIRFPVGMEFNRAGDLFCTDQEGATWLPNGNPLDELLHLQKGRHYGFPPRHPRHLPKVIDEPSTYDYGPQHQSTCGLFFNESVNGGPAFGPESWRGDALVCGYSRGKLYRTKLVKTPHGYVATNQILASLNMLAADCCVSPKGDLVIACHGGGPDWGSGPSGKGKLFKVRYEARDVPQPVAVWPAGPDEVRVTFDRPLDAESLKGLADQSAIQYGPHVRAGDEFEALRPGYDVVRMQMMSARRDLKVRTAQITPDRRTLIVSTDRQEDAAHYALKLPGLGRPPLSKGAKGPIAQHPRIDLDYSLAGVIAKWEGNGSTWAGWLPHLDLETSRALTTGSAEHDKLWKSATGRGKLTLKAKLDLSKMLRPAVQPGSKLDYTLPPERVTVAFVSTSPFLLRGPTGEAVSRGPVKKQVAKLIHEPKSADLVSVEIELTTTNDPPDLAVVWSTDEDDRLRPLAAHRMLVPWAVRNPKAEAVAIDRKVPELEGGSWARGRKVFFGEQAACAKCHTVHGQGGGIGPDLSNLVHRDYHSVLRDLADPSYAINPDHITYRVDLLDGRTLTGSVRTQGDRMLVGDAAGKVVAINKADVESMTASTKSIMPEGLPKTLGPEKLKDLMTFLLTDPPHMPRDYPGQPPAPRTRAEVRAVLAGAPDPPAKVRPIRVVLVAGRKDHGPGEHDYPAWQKAWKELLAAADGIEVGTAWDFPKADDLKSADVLVFYQQGTWTPERAKDIDAFLNRGGGLVYLHYAVDGGKDAPGFAQRIGLAWRGGTSKFRHGPLELGFETGDRHPIGRNFGKVKFTDESYWQLVGDTSKVRVLASGVEDGKPQPLFWTLEPVKGRVFVSILGHYSWMFDDPLFRVLILRGIAWTAREPVDRFNDLVWPGSAIRD
ncbi:MAG TPA: ThuA domain-containing protein [Gemmataceae bacterium]|nr:ThuA domain-containing protein [Gemmataceae bacterium]